MRHVLSHTGLAALTLVSTMLLMVSMMFLAVCAAAAEPPAGHGQTECPAPQPKTQGSAQPATTRPALAAGTIIKLPEGRVVSFEEMMRDLRGVRVVFLGENHNNMAHHEGQLAVIKGLEARVPSLAVGMEMFQRPYQQALDDWVAGKIDQKQLLSRTEWYERWSMDAVYYEAIIDFTRQARAPLVALNAPEELAQAVGSKGISGLTPAQKVQLPDMDLKRPDHRHFIEHLFGNHGGAGMGVHHHLDFENFYQAQALWDEQMAQSIAGYLESPGSAQMMAVIAGNGHIEYGLGTPEDFARRLGCPYRTVSFQDAGQVTWAEGPPPPTPMFDYGRDLANYVWLTAPAGKEKESPKLGVMVGKLPEGVTGVKVAGVSDGSPAAGAGLKEGDVIVAVGSEAVGSLGDLRYILSQHKMGDRLQLSVLRGGKKASVALTLSPLPPMHMNMKMKP